MELFVRCSAIEGRGDRGALEDDLGGDLDLGDGAFESSCIHLTEGSRVGAALSLPLVSMLVRVKGEKGEREWWGKYLNRDPEN